MPTASNAISIAEILQTLRDVTVNYISEACDNIDTYPAYNTVNQGIDYGVPDMNWPGAESSTGNSHSPTEHLQTSGTVRLHLNLSAKISDLSTLQVASSTVASECEAFIPTSRYSGKPISTTVITDLLIAFLWFIRSKFVYFQALNRCVPLYLSSNPVTGLHSYTASTFDSTTMATALKMLSAFGENPVSYLNQSPSSSVTSSSCSSSSSSSCSSSCSCSSTSSSSSSCSSSCSSCSCYFIVYYDLGGM